MGTRASTTTGTEPPSGRRRYTGWQLVQGGLIGLGLVLLLGGFAALAVQYRPYAVPTDSMEPTVHAGDRVLAHRISGSDAQRGDVVVFHDPSWGNLPLVKRVIGVGGDHVACCSSAGRLTVDGHPVKETYLAAKPLGSNAAKQQATSQKFDVTVPPGRLFLLGDHRLDSLDSLAHIADSQHGTVPRSTVAGRVEGIAWPYARIGTVDPGRDDFRAAGLPGQSGGTGLLVPGAAGCVAGAVLLVLVTLLGWVVNGAASARRKREEAAARAESGHD